MILFNREPLTDVIDEMRPMLEDHWRECAHFDDIPLDPDFDAYLMAHRMGKVRLFTVRDYGELVGYALFFLGNMQHKAVNTATQNLVFIHPSYRMGMVGYRFIKYFDEQLADEGVSIVYQTVKPAVDYSPLLERLGYEAVETTYVRRH